MTSTTFTSSSASGEVLGSGRSRLGSRPKFPSWALAPLALCALHCFTLLESPPDRDLFWNQLWQCPCFEVHLCMPCGRSCEATCPYFSSAEDDVDANYSTCCYCWLLPSEHGPGCRETRIHSCAYTSLICQLCRLSSSDPSGSVGMPRTVRQKARILLDVKSMLNKRQFPVLYPRHRRAPDFRRPMRAASNLRCND